MNYIVVSYYTPQYKDLAKRLIKSLDKFDIPHDIEAMETLGGWDENTYHKPFFLKRKLKEHKCPIVWIDVDGELRDYPKYFEFIDENIAVGVRHKSQNQEILSSVIFLNNNPQTKRLVDDWIYFCNEDKEKKIFEQKHLESAIVENCYIKYWTTIFYLPTSYVALKDIMDKGKITIWHSQASRQFRYGRDRKKIKEMSLKDLHWDSLGGWKATFGTKEVWKKYMVDLEKSMRKEGLKKPPLISLSNSLELRRWKEPYRVLHGNHRVEVANKLGWKTISCEIYKR